MSSDRRSPRTDALDTLGSIITENEKRDAIHLAVEPAIAGQRLSPAADVGFLADGTLGLCSPDDCVGIVDPFLPMPVNKGQRFWLVVYPRQITSLRHVWTHPRFPEASQSQAQPEPTFDESDEMAKSRRWIKDFAADLEQTYGRLMTAAEIWLDNKDWTYDNSEIYKAHWKKFPEFWVHYEIVTGRKVDEDDRENFFTCSC